MKTRIHISDVVAVRDLLERIVARTAEVAALDPRRYGAAAIRETLGAAAGGLEGGDLEAMAGMRRKGARRQLDAAVSELEATLGIVVDGVDALLGR